MEQSIIQACSAAPASLLEKEPSCAALWSLLLVNNDNNGVQKDSAMGVTDEWFTHPSCNTNVQRLPSTLLSYFTTAALFGIVQQTSDYIACTILEEAGQTSMRNTRAILRFLRLVATYCTTDTKQDGQIKTISKICSSILAKLSQKDHPQASTTISQYIYYLHPLVLKEGKSFLLSPLWKGVCDLLSRHTNSSNNISETTTICNVFNPLSEYFEKGNKALNQSLSNQTLTAVQNHVKMISFFLARFTFIFQNLSNIQQHNKEPVMNILSKVCLWKGMIYQRKKTETNTHIQTALEVLNPKINSCLQQIMVVDSSSMFYTEPINLMLDSFQTAICHTCCRLRNKEVDERASPDLEYIAIGIFQSLHHVKHLLIDLPLYCTSHEEGTDTKPDNNTIITLQQQWITRLCSTLLHDVIPFLYGIVMTEITDTVATVKNTSNNASMWHCIVDVLLLCIRKLSSSTNNNKKMAFLFSKWLITSSATNPLTSEVIFCVISQHCLEENENDALYLVYIFSNLVFSPSTMTLEATGSLVEVLIRIQQSFAKEHRKLGLVQNCIWQVYCKYYDKNEEDNDRFQVIFPLLEGLPPALFFSDANNKNCVATKKQIQSIFAKMRIQEKENVQHPVIDGRKQSATNTKYCISLLHATLRNCYAAASTTTTDGQRQQQQERAIQSKFQEYAGERLSTVLAFLINPSRANQNNACFILVTLRFLSLAMKYDCMESSLFIPLIRLLEVTITKTTTISPIIQWEASEILREIGKCILSTCEEAVLKPIVPIFQKLLASDFSFVSLNAMTALEHFSSTAPGNHVQWILIQCIPPDKQNHFRKRLQRQMHYFTDEQNKHFRGMSAMMVLFEIHRVEILALQQEELALRTCPQHTSSSKVVNVDDYEVSIGMPCVVLQKDCSSVLCFDKKSDNIDNIIRILTSHGYAASKGVSIRGIAVTKGKDACTLKFKN